jgi:N-acetylmuramoyl-L-alanine amidase
VELALRLALQQSGAALIPALLAIVCAPAAAAGPLRVISTTSEAGAVRIDMETGGLEKAPVAFALSGPDRIVIDLSGVTSTGTSLDGAGPVARLRAAQFDPQTARVVLDLAGPARISSSSTGKGLVSLTITPSTAADFKALVAAGRTRLESAVAAAKSPPSADKSPPAAPAKPPRGAASTPADTKTPAKPAISGLATKKAATKPPPVVERHASAGTAVLPPATPPQPRPSPRRADDTGLPVVVIDAGHGGRDVGAVSVLGKDRYEKEAVLAIAKAIKRELDASGRARAILTRSDDRFLRLRDRFGIARRNRAQLFISVHADSAGAPEARGATVYTLSETASDAEAARLAAKENKSDVIAGVDLSAETSEVSDILIDLAQRETMNTSAQFAALLQAELRQSVKVRSNFHRFAGFLVLKAPDVPSVLLETGYLSNADDAKFLFSPAGQARIAKGVRRAVEAHFLRRLAQR